MIKEFERIDFSMGRQDSAAQYARAVRQGQKYCNTCIFRGENPYPKVLDEFVTEAMLDGRVNLGEIKIPVERIVGKRTAGQNSAFAGNFMPVYFSDSELMKTWTELRTAARSGEGFREPIRCVEYLGNFYVEDGCKRVSVLRALEVPEITAKVTRLLPARSEEAAHRVYEEFLDFYQLSGLYLIRFTREGQYAALQEALGFDAHYIWTPDDRRRFRDAFFAFRDALEELPHDDLAVPDIFLHWLKLYSLSDVGSLPAEELKRTIRAILPDVRAEVSPESLEVSVTPAQPEQNLLTKLFSLGKLTHLNIAFLHSGDPAESDWSRGHDLGRQELERVMGDALTVRTYICGADAQAKMEKAIDEGAQLIFATAPPLIDACRKISVRHPEVRILNCALAMPYTGIRTYYARMYEGKFITGAIAAAVSKSNELGYVADYPICGVPAGINAFALGARMVNPHARVVVRWSCLPGNPTQELRGLGIDVISNREPASQEADQWALNRGTFRFGEDGSAEPLASPCWDWGKLYERMVKLLMDGGWGVFESRALEHAVNYWWGMDSGVVDVKLSDSLPAGVHQLASILKIGLAGGSFDPFREYIVDQDGTVRNDGSRSLLPEEIMHMDWLCENVVGTIPAFEDILPISRNTVRLLGLKNR